MKLADMSFKRSREVQAQVVPVIEDILTNEETAGLFDAKYSSGTGKKGLAQSASAGVELINALLDNHYDQLCKILSVINDTNVDELEAMKRGDVNKLIADLLNDQDLISFFMSSEALGRAVQSAISQNPSLLTQEAQTST